MQEIPYVEYTAGFTIGNLLTIESTREMCNTVAKRHNPEYLPNSYSFVSALNRSLMSCKKRGGHFASSRS
jgi:hypothetical protein